MGKKKTTKDLNHVYVHENDIYNCNWQDWVDYRYTDFDKLLELSVKKDSKHKVTKVDKIIVKQDEVINEDNQQESYETEEAAE